MATYTDTQRPLSVTTPLGPDALLLTGFSGQEAVSHLFSFHLDCLAKGDVDFAAVLGKSVTVTIATPKVKRVFNGICSRISQAERDLNFTRYRLEVVPKLWLLSKKAQSRIFQQKSVKDILQEVLGSVSPEINLKGTYEPRDYCVQYRETDLNFATRLMEEEGIFYFFKHSDGNHTMVVADSAGAFANVSDPSTVNYKSGEFAEGTYHVFEWEKAQELRSGKVTLWDHCFELPHKHLEAEKTIQGSVTVGGVSHNLQAGNNGPLEIYDWPGEYAQRFDGVSPGGGDRSSDVDKIFKDNTRTVGLRMEEEAAGAIAIQGAGNCQNFTAGYKFTLSTLPDTLEKKLKVDGSYVLTAVHHSARQAGNYLSGAGADFHYQNTFTCIPAALPYRPQRSAPKPVVHGTQTAVVVGPSGEEIFTDKYGRVKVQFHWDRQGKNDADSSCWCRVGTLWAGKQWGMIHIPRIGQEVIVAFEEGDPDRPIVVGSVYNAEMMPPYKLPDNKTQSGLKTRSSLKGTDQNFNELRFEDKKDSEEVYFHAEKDFNRVVENNDTLKVGSSKKDPGDRTVTIFNNETVTVGDGKGQAQDGSRTHTVFNNDKLTVGDPQAQDGSQTISIYKDRTATLQTGNDNLTIQQGNRSTKLQMGNDTLELQMGNQSTKLDLGSSSTEAMQSITLKVGANSITIDQTGITLDGIMIKIQGQAQTQVQGAMVQVSGEAMTQISGGVTMIG